RIVAHVERAARQQSRDAAQVQILNDLDMRQVPEAVGQISQDTRLAGTAEKKNGRLQFLGREATQPREALWRPSFEIVGGAGRDRQELAAGMACTVDTR